MVLYAKVVLSFSKSETWHANGRGTVDYMPNIDRLLSGFVSLIRVCHPSARQMKQFDVQLYESGRSLRT